jgi:hypothetical protein
MKRRINHKAPRPDDGLLPGPAACMRVRGARRRCDDCNVMPTVLHVPIAQRGQFCPECCPCCKSEPKPAA